jgi:hypothetical protein
MGMAVVNDVFDEFRQSLTKERAKKGRSSFPDKGNRVVSHFHSLFTLFSLLCCGASSLPVPPVSRTIQKEGDPTSRRNAMDRDTFDNTIRAFKQRTAFRPFTVSFVNGERVEVDHPDALVVRDGVALFVGPGGVPAVFDYEGVAQVIGDLVRPPPGE